MKKREQETRQRTLELQPLAMEKLLLALLCMKSAGPRIPVPCGAPLLSCSRASSRARRGNVAAPGPPLLRRPREAWLTRSAAAEGRSFAAMHADSTSSSRRPARGCKVCECAACHWSPMLCAPAAAAAAPARAAAAGPAPPPRAAWTAPAVSCAADSSLWSKTEPGARGPRSDCPCSAQLRHRHCCRAAHGWRPGPEPGDMGNCFTRCTAAKARSAAQLLDASESWSWPRAMPKRHSDAANRQVAARAALAEQAAL